jgi:hypothetical protein
MLREMAFVYKATQTVRESLMQETGSLAAVPD